MKVGLISLGCPRNLVDSETIIGSLKRDGFRIGDVEKGVDVAIVNTCAFIRSAKEESIDTILELSQLKKEGKVARIVVCGCLSQFYRDRLLGQMPEVDLVVGTSDFPKLGKLIRALGGGRRRSLVSARAHYLYDEHSPRKLLTPAHYAYVKIAEGCSNFCSYCVISRLRGSFRSRSIESVASEVRKLTRPGALKEIILVAQDTTLFGMDRYGKQALPQLLKKICALDNDVEWIRLLYTHPAHYTNELIDTIVSERKICRYLDLPVQHISDRILKAMNRRMTGRDIKTLIERLRKAIPKLALRTSIIVGFPGETDKDFRQLLDFVHEAKFERLGAFVYSREEATHASTLRHQVPEAVRQRRLDELMTLQKKISEKANRRFMGRTLKVLIDEKCADERGLFLGRTERDAPEIDGVVYVSGNSLDEGHLYDVRVTDTFEYDLAGAAL